MLQTGAFLHICFYKQRLMIYILSFTIFALIGAIVYLSISLRKSRKSHLKKMETLQKMIVQLVASQNAQSDHIRLSENLKEKLHSANTTLSHDILTMMREFIEVLSKNNLLKK